MKQNVELRIFPDIAPHGGDLTPRSAECSHAALRNDTFLLFARQLERSDLTLGEADYKMGGEICSRELVRMNWTLVRTEELLLDLYSNCTHTRLE
ncbi:hypothetical protein RRG08_056831 [Elysia crispata]|uniref:Uncharacterized protein n=1 Tax=Elysia crispata TaxID=231223 RepID=A0AAE1DVS6_9GAST|nr:hypothetical protein RRG08_056831 [Elysia crispata]